MLNNYSIKLLIVCLILSSISLVMAQDRNYVLNPDNSNFYLAVPGNILWSDANTAAHSMNYQGCQGHLATITSAEENQFLVDNNMVSYYWLGGFQQADGAWAWVTDEPFNYTNWSPGEPSGDAPQGDGKLHFFTADGKWNDFQDAMMPAGYIEGAGYVVEFECDYTLNPSNGHYYLAVDGALSWSQANEAANALTYQGCQGHLATITSQEETDFLINSGQQYDYWIGGFQADGSVEPDGGWQWVTGEPFEYTNWAAGEPNDARQIPTGENSLQLSIQDQGVANAGKWNDNIDDPDPTKRGNLNGYLVEFDCESVFQDGLPETCVGTIGLTVDQLTGSTWQFGRADGTLNPGEFVLNADGTVGVWNNQNERHWTVENGVLIIIAEDGTPSTCFSSAETVDDMQVLQGAFLLVPEWNITHVLRRNAP